MSTKTTMMQCDAQASKGTTQDIKEKESSGEVSIEMDNIQVL